MGCSYPGNWRDCNNDLPPSRGILFCCDHGISRGGPFHLEIYLGRRVMKKSQPLGVVCVFLFPPGHHGTAHLAEPRQLRLVTIHNVLSFFLACPVLLQEQILSSESGQPITRARSLPGPTPGSIIRKLP